MPVDPVVNYDDSGRATPNYAMIVGVNANVPHTDNNGIPVPGALTLTLQVGYKDPGTDEVTWYHDLTVNHRVVDGDLTAFAMKATNNGEKIWKALRRCCYEQLKADGLIDGTITAT